MRQRGIPILVRLNVQEQQSLVKQVKKSGLSNGAARHRGEKDGPLCRNPRQRQQLQFHHRNALHPAFPTALLPGRHVYGGRLPLHVHFVMDEFSNVALPDEFDKLLSTMRSREVRFLLIR